MIKAENLSVALAGAATLSELSFEIQPGSFTAILGPNGAGKTTLLRTILGHQKHTGNLTVNARNIAYVPQRPELPAGISVAEYVSLGRAPVDGWGRRANPDLLSRTLAKLDLTHLAKRQLTALSGGEAQRAVLARALIQQPDLLLLDEPTTGLDLHHRAAYLDHLKHLQTQGLTIISSLHDLTLAARIADNALLMRDGQLIAAAPIPQVIQSPQLAATFQNSVRIERLPDGTFVAI